MEHAGRVVSVPGSLPEANLPITEERPIGGTSKGSVTSVSSAGPKTASLSINAQIQIAGLQALKAGRTFEEKKISSQLLRLLAPHSLISNGGTAQDQAMHRDEKGRVLVDLKADISERFLDQLRGVGSEIVNSFREYQSCRAWIPLNQIRTVASASAVTSIRPAVQAITHSGLITSQGDVTHQAAAARELYDVTGAGVKIGVLSDSVNHLSESQTAGELDEVNILPGQAGDGDGEGTAMLEIIHDLSPGAELYFATAMNGPAAFAHNVRELRSAGCNIIVDDVEYYDESPFQDGIVAQAVNAATGAGVLFFSSAGNSGNQKSGRSSVWEGDYSAGSEYAAGGNYHLFGSQSFNTVLEAESRSYVSLHWSDALGSSRNDYDLYVLDAAGENVVASSDDFQGGYQDPWEFIPHVEAGQKIVVVCASGAARFLHLEIGKGRLEFGTGGSIRGHSCASDAYCVAAVRASASFPNAFAEGSSEQAEYFSSDGPRRMFYAADGTAFTAGNLLSSGGVIRQKPDIAAADGVSTSVPGFTSFYGTSAAAPHAAAIAALIKSAKPDLSPSELRAALTSSALDIEAPGFDPNVGYGIVMAPGALDAIGLVVQSVPVDPSHVRLNLAPSELGIEITAEGAPGQIYEIESSNDLENWVYVSTLINELGSVRANLNSSERQIFYRLLVR
jgi:subtilisin family serine protease